MAKRKPKMDEAFFPIEGRTEPQTERDEPQVVALRSLRPGKLVMVGPITGARYTWPYPGAIVSDVDAADAAVMVQVQKTLTACCGGAAMSYYYVEEVN